MSARLWDRAGSLPVPASGRPRPEVAALAPGLPTVAELFSFMRDAELRFDTLRLRIEERTMTARGEQLVVTETVLRHPGHAKVLTSEPGRGLDAAYEVWITDGDSVRTYSKERNLATHRPARPLVRGVADARDLPGMARLYVPLTELPMETLPELFVHPAGYCQNVLATGACTIPGTALVAGREAIVVDCAHPRAVEVVADRPDFHIRVSVDRADGVILRLEESMGGVVTRDATATVYEPNAPLPPAAFEFAVPSDAVTLY